MQQWKMSDQDYAALARLMPRIDLFSGMTPVQLGAFLEAMMVYSCQAGEVVFRQGEAGDAFYIVFEGRVGIRIKKGFFASAKTVASLGPGDFFGEMALLGPGPRTATAVCSEPTKLFVLLRADFEEVVRQNPRLAAGVKQAAARRRFASDHSG